MRLYFPARNFCYLVFSLAFSLINVNLAAAQSGWETPAVLEGAMNISVEELVDFKAEFSNIVIIDTGPHDTTQPISIEGAHALSAQSISPIVLTQLASDKFTPLVFFGTDPGSIHSYKAAKQAVILGYINVYWFRGGLKEWLDKGMPVVKLQE